MREIQLDGRDMPSREVAHAYLRNRLGLPGYYGRNLDALYDCLTDIGEPTRITLEHADALTETMGRYGVLLTRVFEDAAAHNPNVRFEMRF
ncbi:barstar family protein [Eubacteriales bacterium OttesenSCG-928-A19]|nr:barstar family protein [Eubacteriales bacterium OttesenSCG-928-A19]